MTAPVIPALGALLSALLLHSSRRVEAGDRARELVVTWSHPPGRVLARVERALLAADVGLDARTAIQLWLLAALAAGCAAAGLEPTLAIGAIGAVLVGGPVALAASRYRGARRRAAELPVALELVASELRTGGTVAVALDTLARGSGPLAAEFARINRRRSLGAPVGSALEAWATERAEASVSSAAGALAVATTTGGRAADALDGLAASLRDRAEIAAESRALSAQARLSAIVVGSLPIAYLIASAFFDVRQIHLLTSSPFGLACLGLGLTLEGVAVLWIRVLLRLEA